MDNNTEYYSKAQTPLVYIVFGFASFGLLTGSISGLSSANLTLPLVGLLFGFAGGSVIAFIGKIPKNTIALAGVAIGSFSLAAVIALYLGLFVKVNEILFIDSKEINLRQKLSSHTDRDNTPSQQSYRDLLRADKSQSLDQYLKDEVAFGHVSLSEACKQLIPNTKNLSDHDDGQ